MYKFISMLQENTISDFIFDLEYYLSFSRENFINKRFWGFWCDGIQTDFKEVEVKKAINDKGIVEVMMYFGQNGQDEYRLIIYFGRKSISRSARGLNLRVCLPDRLEEADMILIDVKNKIVELQLK